MTPKQQAFIDQYLVDFNATQAAIRAGYSPKTARATGNENLKKPNIQRALTKAIAARQERVQISQDNVVAMLSREAEAGNLEEPNGARIRAQELLGKHLGMFTQRIEHSGEIQVRTLADIAKEAAGE